MTKLLMTALTLSLLLLSGEAFAHGWMEFKLAKFTGPGKVGPTLSVGLREPLALGVNYLSWNGIGVDVRESVWMTSSHDLELELTDTVSVSTGVSLRHNDVNYSDVHIALKTQLWE